jgi:hypothetical protein
LSSGYSWFGLAYLYTLQKPDYSDYRYGLALSFAHPDDVAIPDLDYQPAKKVLFL